MKVSKCIVASFLLFSFLSTTSTLFAAESVTVATVNILNQKIISQEKNTFLISFSLSNREGLQTGVKYGVQLLSSDGKYIADQKLYDESITLYENSTLNEEITYVAPSQLTGAYNLYLISSNESNFPFGVVSLGKVTLESSSKGFEILPNSCYLKIEGDAKNTHYNLLENVDISKDEQLRLTCNTRNNSTDALSLTPVFKTEYSFAQGKLSPEVGGDMMPISFGAQKNESFSIVLPKGTTPQFYNLSVFLTNGIVNSNAIFLRYIIQGVNATIQNVSLSKDYYRANESGSFSLLWSASAGTFARSITKATDLPAVTVSAQMINENGRECIDPISQVLEQDRNNPLTTIPFTIKTTCKNPQLAVTITDKDGNTLDQKDFAFTSGIQPEVKPLSKRLTVGIIVALLAVIGVGIYISKRKGSKAEM